MNYIVLTALPILLAYVLNKFFTSFLSAPIQGAGSFLSVYFVLVQLFELEFETIELVVSGVLCAIILDRYSRTLDASEGPSQTRSEIQGVGVYMLIAACVIALLIN